MSQYLSVAVGTHEIAGQIADDGSMIASLINDVGYSVGGDPRRSVLAEFAEALDDDGRKVLVQLATAAGLIPEGGDE